MICPKCGYAIKPSEILRIASCWNGHIPDLRFNVHQAKGSLPQNDSAKPDEFESEFCWGCLWGRLSQKTKFPASKVFIAFDSGNSLAASIRRRRSSGCSYVRCSRGAGIQGGRRNAHYPAQFAKKRMTVRCRAQRTLHDRLYC
jgi:hypothetical protein